MSFVFLEEHENVLDMYTEDNHIPKKKKPYRITRSLITRIKFMLILISIYKFKFLNEWH